VKTGVFIADYFTECEDRQMSLDWTIVTADKLAGMVTIAKKSPVFRLWKSGNPSWQLPSAASLTHL